MEIIRDMTSWMKSCYDMHIKSDDPNSTIEFTSIMHTKEWKKFVMHSVELQTVISQTWSTKVKLFVALETIIFFNFFSPPNFWSTKVKPKNTSHFLTPFFGPLNYI